MTDQMPRGSNGYAEQLNEYQQTKFAIKRRLYAYKDLITEHHQLLDRLKHLESIMGSPSSSKLSGMPRGSGANLSAVESLVDRHIALERRYEKMLGKLVNAQNEVEDLIAALEPTERILARYRYIDGLAWEKICDKMNYSWRQIHRIHNKMLDRLVAAELEKNEH